MFPRTSIFWVCLFVFFWYNWWVEWVRKETIQSSMLRLVASIERDGDIWRNVQKRVPESEKFNIILLNPDPCSYTGNPIRASGVPNPQLPIPKPACISWVGYYIYCLMVLCTCTCLYSIMSFRYIAEEEEDNPHTKFLTSILGVKQIQVQLYSDNLDCI